MVLLPWVASDTERPTPPFLCARPGRAEPCAIRGDFQNRSNGLEFNNPPAPMQACALRDPAHASAIAGDRAFVIQIDRPVIGQGSAGCFRQNRPTLQPKRAQRRPRRSLKHKIKMRLLDTIVPQDDPAKFGNCFGHRREVYQVRGPIVELRLLARNPCTGHTSTAIFIMTQPNHRFTARYSSHLPSASGKLARPKPIRKCRSSKS